MSEYFATSQDMETVFLPKILSMRGYYLQYNPNIKMYRLNNDEEMPDELMGYSPHKKQLIDRAIHWVKTHAVK